MPLPIILIDSATGSDSLASGAGPAIALTGSDASTSGDGLTVTVPNADLTDVAVDGSHVIYLADATTGARNFGAITAKADSGLATANVRVGNAFGLSLSGLDYAIGGKRASIGGTQSKKLFDNNATAGDAMAGWVVELVSGHTETIAANFIFRRAGDPTDGPIILRGASGAATLPVITFSNNGEAFNCSVACLQLMDFEIRNSSATKTASVAIAQSGRFSPVRRMKISHVTDKFWRGIVCGNGVSGEVSDCEIGSCAEIGLVLGNNVTEVHNNWIHDCTGHGISASATSSCTHVIHGNLIEDNGGDGISIAGSITNEKNLISIVGNSIYSNANGIASDADWSANTTMQLSIRNNIFDDNGVKDINFSHANMNTTVLAARGWTFLNNCFRGTTTPAGIGENNQTADPQFTDAAGGDFSIGTNLKAKGHPLGGTTKIGTYSNTYSYVDIGASQREEAAGIGAGTSFFGPAGVSL